MKFKAFDRRVRMLAQRPWTDRERRIVWSGLSGRIAIAVEPLLGMGFMTFLALGILYRSNHVPADHDLRVIAPIFGLGAVLFFVYFICVLMAPFVAYLQTYKPIYIIDGYMRYRGPDDQSEIDATGYTAALFHDETVACEWECFGSTKLPDKTIPALVEFSVYAGVHKIDGRNTGLLPDTDLPLLAIGIKPPK